jgi:hypothetical protein
MSQCNNVTKNVVCHQIIFDIKKRKLKNLLYLCIIKNDYPPKCHGLHILITFKGINI